MLRGGLARPRRAHRGRGFRHRERTGGKGAAQHLEGIEGSGMFVRQPRRGPEHFRQKTQRRRRHEQEAQRGADQARVVRGCDRRRGVGFPQRAFRNAAGRAEDGRHNGRPAGTGNREGPCGPPRSGPARRAFRHRRAGRRFGGGAGRARTGSRSMRRSHRPNSRKTSRFIKTSPESDPACRNRKGIPPPSACPAPAARSACRCPANRKCPRA